MGARTTFTQSAASYGPPGLPTISNGFQLDWNHGTGASNDDGSFVDIEVQNSSLTLAMLENTTFYVDVLSGITGNTGIINFSFTSPTPLPAAALLFGPVLGIGYLGLRRRRRAVRAPVAA